MGSWSTTDAKRTAEGHTSRSSAPHEFRRQRFGLPSHLMLRLNYILALRKKGGVHFCMHTFGGEGLPPLADRRSHARNGVVTELLRSGAQPKRSWSCSGHIWLPIAVVCIPCGVAIVVEGGGGAGRVRPEYGWPVLYGLCLVDFMEFFLNILCTAA